MSESIAVAGVVEAEEAALSAHYHQPKQVEQFGVEPIPAALKTVRWYDLFFIIINFMINPATILTAGMAVAAGLSFWAAVAAQTFGCLIAFSAYIALATIGVDYGLPGQVGTRITFGLSGSRWLTSLPRSIASVYWFSFQAIAGSIIIVGAWDRWQGGHHSLIAVSIFFSLGQVIVAVIGYESLKVLSRIAFPVKLLILAAILVVMARYPDPAFHPANVFHFHGRVGWSWPIFVVWMNGMAAAWLTMITDAADFCRYSRSRQDMWVGTISAALIGTLVASFIGAYGAAATLGNRSNIFEVVTSITTSHLMLLLIVILIVLENWTINVLNLYTGGLSLTNMFGSVGRFWTTLAIGIAGVVLSTQAAVVHGYMQYTTELGNLFAPIAGVLLADYLFIKQGRIDLASLYSRNGMYWYWHGVNPVAVLWVAAGLATYFLLPVAAIQSLATVLITGAGYFVSMKLLVPRSARLARASAPVIAEAEAA
jgi:NCS1 family nucleobase:cation symporter-1